MTLDWHAEDPHIVECILLYLYTSTYPDWHRIEKQKHSASTVKTSPTVTWKTDIGIFKLADMLMLNELRDIARQRLSYAISGRTIDNKFNKEPLNDVGLIEEVWNLEQDCAGELREQTLMAVSASMGRLIEQQGFNKMLLRIPSLAMDCFQKLLDKEEDTFADWRVCLRYLANIAKAAVISCSCNRGTLVTSIKSDDEIIGSAEESVVQDKENALLEGVAQKDE